MQSAFFTNPGFIYSSTSGGSVWTKTSAPQAFWGSIASDSTGQTLVASQYNENGNEVFIYTSTSGTTYYSDFSLSYLLPQISQQVAVVGQRRPYLLLVIGMGQHLQNRLLC